ncbi:3-hydroxyacyl-ACP dehydratase FabZ [Wansuia hejianensis]|uniref:3-hydroxyacyl-[acyl-carrier-protein] dehydratase FabZ n=1 Tax=Wansuia hejianensis TaxID=2763667 RepID=A0A926F333_9FIRM|nr:3-hydroxyacyl-ACP dehydratase FabZ [Wansuia hejianensis]MBC8591019.1 3-hydroxyacyl-ACP dehydratase FabZ [Wansuia hejianensis]
MKVLSIEDIMEIIPHRYPFLFVDKVKILDPGVKGIGYKNVTINEYYFQGHYPNMPIMPGVIIIETMAQVGVVILLSHEDFKGNIPYFAGINKFRFKRKVIPGDTLRIEVEITKLRGSIGIGQGKAFVEDRLVAEGEFMFAIESL